MGWASDEFVDINLGDKRLNSRLIKLCDSFSESPESPINQACADWAETKAAYRFFQNKNVDVEQIMSAHRGKTLVRAASHRTVLALQDTSYLIYTNHPKTEGLGKISMKNGKNIDKIYSRGLVMHTCFAVTTKGTPLGLFEQKIFARQLHPEHERRTAGGRNIQDVLPVEEKESYRWIKSLEATTMVRRIHRSSPCVTGNVISMIFSKQPIKMVLLWLYELLKIALSTEAADMRKRVLQDYGSIYYPTRLPAHTQ
jgi:hypothetical protein